MQPAGKVELHCHLDGVVGPECLAALRTRGIDLNVDEKALRSSMPIRGWDHWTAQYQLLLAPALQPAERLLPVMRWHIEALIRQRVTYAELMVGGLLNANEPDPVPVVERYRAFRQAADEAAGRDVEIVFLVAIRRGLATVADRVADRIALAAREGLVRGIAIAANELVTSIRDWERALDRLRDLGLGIEIHAGELGGPDSVRDALKFGRPDRLGHAVRAFEDERLVAELQERDVHIEFCPSSNVCLGVVPSIEAHPIRTARELGMNFGINTDDPGPFACTLESEYALLKRTFGFTAEDFARANANAWRSRFGGRDRR